MANKRNVTVRMKADLEYEARNPQGNVVNIDMYDPEHKQAQSPMDLLLSALGGCASVDAVLMMKKKTPGDRRFLCGGRRNSKRWGSGFLHRHRIKVRVGIP